MSNELIINITCQETRIALMENGVLVEYHVERAKDRGIVSNIYKGKVIRVLPGMQAAFVDVGLERAAFLYVADVSTNKEEDIGRLMGEEEGENGNEQDFLEKKYKEKGTDVPIEELLREGEEILVQVAKEPLGTKGARITGYITLPSRHLVMMPTVNHVGISRRIEKEEERKRLKETVESLRPDGYGFIVRTAADGKDEETLKTDINFLVNQWEEIQSKNDQIHAPSMLHAELGITLRAIRDLFSSDIERVVIDSKREYENILESFGKFMPRLNYSVELYEGEEPIFDHYGLEIEIARALQRKVWLKSGGYIVIEHTEALTAIDVNTGRFVGKRNLEDTIIRTNLEAVKEICYQLRLRNIGGIIIIDFIDMDKEVNREKVYNALQEALKKDRARTNILKISELGLVEMTRKRTRESITKVLSESCPYCEGKGTVKSRPSICYEIFREIHRRAPISKSRTLIIHVNAEIADMLYEEEREGLEDLEQRFNKRIIVKDKVNFHIEQFEIQES